MSVIGRKEWRTPARVVRPSNRGPVLLSRADRVSLRATEQPDAIMAVEGKESKQ